jgi:signal transduction histidine kinase
VAQDVANERLTRALVADRAAARSRSDRREQERVLHDTVLSTLTALARGSLPDSDAVRARCAADARFLRAMHEADDLDDPPDLVTALLAIARDTAHPEVVVEGETITVELPAQVAVAILRAAGEAVRNAGRHSGADRVEVRIAAVGTGVTVEIVDDGRGFAPGDGRGLGIRRSITERMGDVGGYGTVEHVSGRGTRVVLAWPR